MPGLNANPMQPFLDAIAPVIADELGWVAGSLPRFIQQTLLQRYSKDRPLYLVSDVAGTGTAMMPMPVAPGSQFGTFDPLFSEIKKIEYPIGQIPDEDVRSEDWEIYRSPTGYQLVLSAYVPQVGQSARLTWTAQHAPDGSTVPQVDFYAVCDYAASLALEAMAARASQFGDNTMGADSTNYRSKAQEYVSLAAKIRKRYFNHMGIEENVSGVESKAAISTGNLRNIMGTAGVDRLVHGKDTR
jgi:hypothetical protein